MFLAQSVIAGGVIDGQLVNASVTNAAYMFKNSNDSTNYILSILNATQSTTSSNGAFIVTGGLGIGKRINAGGPIACTDTTESSSSTTGSVLTSGGLGVAKSINAGGTILGSNLSGSNSGDVSLTVFGSTPAAAGASLSGQALTLQPADATHAGGLSLLAQAITGVKTFSSAPILSSLTASLPLQLDGSKNVISTAIDLSGSQATGTLAAGRFPALLSDVTTSAGSLSTTVAKIQGTTVSGTTGSTNVVFSTSPTFSTSLLLNGSSSGTITIKPQAAAGTFEFDLPTTAGTTGQFLTSQGGAGTAMTWTTSSALTNPMTTGGDIIYGGSSGTPTRLANGSSGQFLQSSGSTAAPTWGTLPGNYYWNGQYILSASNYWTNTNTSTGDFTVNGTIPTVTTNQTGGFSTISNATSNLPGINFSAPRTGTLKISMYPSIYYGLSATQFTWSMEIFESTTSTVVGSTSGNIVGNNVANLNSPTLVNGYFNTTNGVTYNFKLRGAVNTGTLYLGLLSNSVLGSQFSIWMEYIN